METVSCVTEGSPSDAGSRAHVADPPVCAGRRTDQLTQQIQVSLKQTLMFAVREVRGQAWALDRSEHISWGKNEPEVHEKKIKNI